VATDKAKRTTISILQQTKDALDSMKHPGQSYEGLIQELLQFWRDKKGEYWTRRQEQSSKRLGKIEKTCGSRSF